MDAIKLLRQRAADKRDKAIKDARHEFQKLSQLLDMLEEAVGDEPAPLKRRQRLWRPIIDVLAEVIPKDRTFTIDEAVELLKQREPGRDFNPQSVRTLFPEMAKAGIVRKVRRTAGGFVHWAAAELEVTDDPIAVLSYGDATERVLMAKGPLTPVEIVVALKESGYKPHDDPRSKLRSLMDSFKRNRKRFHRGVDGRWSISASSRSPGSSS
jgi:hypothetical protein